MNNLLPLHSVTIHSEARPLRLRDEQGLDISPVDSSTRSSGGVVPQRIRGRQRNEIPVLKLNDLKTNTSVQETPIRKEKNHHHTSVARNIPPANFGNNKSRVIIRKPWRAESDRRN